MLTHHFKNGAVRFALLETSVTESCTRMCVCVRGCVCLCVCEGVGCVRGEGTCIIIGTYVLWEAEEFMDSLTRMHLRI